MAVAQVFTPQAADAAEPSTLQAVIEKLKLMPHPEGGYFVETDRDSWTIPSPFPVTESNPSPTRNASTSIYYLLTPKTPQGHFHRNSGRTVHTLHWGRARYVLIHADGKGREKQVESYVVGKDVLKGEKLQWIVDGGKYKASYLLPDEEGGQESAMGCLISETVVPGFEFSDHDFLDGAALKEMVPQEQSDQLGFLLRKG